MTPSRSPILALLAALVSGVLGLAAPAQAAVQFLPSARGDDGTEYRLAVAEGLRRGAKGAPRAAFRLAVDPPQPDGSSFEPPTVRSVSRVPLAAPRGLALGGALRCLSEGGGEFVYGTAGRGVRRVVAIFADGSRHRLGRFVAPRRWNYSGTVVGVVVPSKVGLLGVRAYGRGGRRLLSLEFAPASQCAFKLPDSDAAAPDKRILNGTVAARLVRAEHRWHRARIANYDYRFRIACFCTPRKGSDLVRVRGGAVVSGRLGRIDALYKLIRRLIEDRPDELTVRYGRFGVPKLISVDQDKTASDDEVAYTIRSFRRR